MEINKLGNIQFTVVEVFMYKSKKEIVRDFNELELTQFVDFQIKEVGSERLLFGIDYPAFNHAISILSVLKATDDDSNRMNIFSKNAKLLLNI